VLPRLGQAIEEVRRERTRGPAAVLPPSSDVDVTRDRLVRAGHQHPSA